MEFGQVANFAAFVSTRHGFDWRGDFQALWKWSVDQNIDFWDTLWDWHGVIGEKNDANGTRLIENPDAMPGARFSQTRA